MVNYKPMLAVDCGDVTALTFPLIASPKLDGVRAIITEDAVLSRSLKPIPNRAVQEALQGLPVGFDGELLVGPWTAPDVYRKTVSVVMSEDKPITGLVYAVFDIQRDGPFMERHTALQQFNPGICAVQYVPQMLVLNLPSLLVLEEQWVTAGYEGAILRKPDAPYKHGRSTVKEGYLLKLKRFVDGEAEVIGVTELMHNGNEATTNELGRTARSHKKEGLVPTGTMGTLVVRDVKTGVEFEIGTGFTAEERQAIWNAHINSAKDMRWGWLTAPSGKYGKLAKYKHFPVGAKDKPRHPVFLGWRDRRDT